MRPAVACDVLFGGVAGMCSRVSDAFGWQFVASLVLGYGAGQGVSHQLWETAMQYFALDTVGLSPADWGRLSAFASLPWSVKPLIGYMSDMRWSACCGALRRSPYLLAGGVLGVLSGIALSVISLYSIALGVLGLFLAALTYSLATAIVDVVIDAVLAERAIERPPLTADMQGLAQTTVGVCYVFVPMVQSYLLESVGVLPLFELSAFAMLLVALPALCGWFERPLRTLSDAGSTTTVTFAGAATRTQGEDLDSQEAIIRHTAEAAVMTSSVALASGILNVSLGSEYPLLVGGMAQCANAALCVLLYRTLRRIDEWIARAALFNFVSNALYANSNVMWEWQHEPAKSNAQTDHRCFTIEECAGLNMSDPAWLDPSELPCGWARQRELPCISPMAFAYIAMAGAASFVVATGIYTTCLQTVSYRAILLSTQVGFVLGGLADLLLVSRYNQAIGISDHTFLLFERIVRALNFRLNLMPLFTLLTQLCPPGVEATMFALMMGLGNFGSASGRYLGSTLLNLLGGVTKPDYHGLETYLLVVAAISTSVIALIPLTVPEGCPSDGRKLLGRSAREEARRLLL